MHIFWFIPTHGDGRYLGTSNGARAVDGTYMRQIAAAADRLGFEGGLNPDGKFLRGSMDRSCVAHPSHQTPKIPRRPSARLDVADGRRENGSHFRPHLRRAAAH